MDFRRRYEDFILEEEEMKISEDEGIVGHEEILEFFLENVDIDMRKREDDEK